MKMLLTQPIFHRPELTEVRRLQIRTIQWVWYNNPVKIDNVFHGLQTSMGPGVVVLQEKGCLLLLHEILQILGDVQLVTR